MNPDFKKLLVKWNKGILRGAQRKFAARMGVKEATVSHWVNGSFIPDETLRPRIAEELGVSIKDFTSRFCFPSCALARNPGRVTHCIPVVGAIEAGNFFFDPKAAPDELLPLSYESAAEVVALKVATRKLAPLALQGEYAVIALGGEAKARGLSVVKENGKCVFSTEARPGCRVLGTVKYFLRKP